MPIIEAHELKLIFIGIPRTETLTVRQLLDAHIVHPLLPQDQDFALPLDHEQRVDHATARELRTHLDKQVWQDYFIFTIVRNPWDRVVSWFNCDFFRRQGIDFEDWLIAGGLGDPDYSINHIAPATLCAGRTGALGGGFRRWALEYLVQGLDIAPYDRSVVTNTAAVLHALNKHADAITLCCTYLEYHPDDDGIRAQLDTIEADQNIQNGYRQAR